MTLSGKPLPAIPWKSKRQEASRQQEMKRQPEAKRQPEGGRGQADAGREYGRALEREFGSFDDGGLDEVLEVHSISAACRPEELHSALSGAINASVSKSAVQLTPISDSGDRMLAAFSSGSAARQALTKLTSSRLFKLRALTDSGVSAATIAAAKALDHRPATQRPRATGSTASRLITSNLKLTKEEREEARKVRSEKELVVAGARKEAAEARQRKQEVDAVWDEE